MRRSCSERYRSKSDVIAKGIWENYKLGARCSCLSLGGAGHGCRLLAVGCLFMKMPTLDQREKWLCVILSAASSSMQQPTVRDELVSARTRAPTALDHVSPIVVRP